MRVRVLRDPEGNRPDRYVDDVSGRVYTLEEAIALAVALVQATPSDGGAHMIDGLIVLGDIETTRDGAISIGLELIRAAAKEKP